MRRRARARGSGAGNAFEAAIAVRSGVGAKGSGGVVLRVAALLAVLALATWGAHLIRNALDLQIRPDNERQVHRAIMLGAVAYVGVPRLPFAPGAEIGLAMRAAFGPATAPLVYVCTVASMTLAYVVGRFLPILALERLLPLLRMRRAAARGAGASALEERSTGHGGPAPGPRGLWTPPTGPPRHRMHTLPPTRTGSMVVPSLG